MEKQMNNPVEIINKKFIQISEKIKNGNEQKEILNELETLKNKTLETIIFYDTSNGQKEKLINEFEEEHIRSLSLIIENESQKMLLNEMNQKLSEEIKQREMREKELISMKKKLERLNKKLKDLSFLDGLTGVANRRYFNETIKREWNRSIRISKPMSLIMLDIDFFKLYNDTYGHVKGDNCLKIVAKTLLNSLKRSGDFLARYGGEEFIAILPNTDQDGAMIVAENMKNNINNLYIRHESSRIHMYLTISLGVASTYPKRDNIYSNLILSADKALYMAKLRGRNQIVISSN